MKSNDLVDFMNSMTREIQSEYYRIQKRATEDPGTAGDQGEENWATLIANWLPSNFKIVTKGRIINEDGNTSPQVDLIVLPPEYPNYLLDKKLYLAGGILAAFECKLTLKSKHIEDFVKNSVAIRKLYKNRTGTPYNELHSPMIYGLLAHSHIWKQENSRPIQKIGDKLKEFDYERITSPIHMPDLICVADLATWKAVKVTINEPIEKLKTKAFYSNKHWNISTGYVCHSNHLEDQVLCFSPIGALITNLFIRLAWEYPSLRNLARYFEMTKIGGSGHAKLRLWENTIFTNETRKLVENRDWSKEKRWDENSWSFP